MDDKKLRALLMVGAIVAGSIFLTSMDVEFEVQSDGGKRLTIDFMRGWFSSDAPTMQKDSARSEELVAEARQLIDDENFSKAIELASQALTLDPENMHAYVERGRAYYYSESYDKALDDIDRAIAAGVELAVSYNTRGCVYFAREQWDEALENFDRATASDPNYYRPYLNRGKVYALQNDFARARQEFDRAIEIEPSLIRAHMLKYLAGYQSLLDSERQQ